VSRVNPIVSVDARKLLVERVAGSRYIVRSARLRDLLVYLCDRVLDDGVDEIHEQEVGNKVFGRPPDYDTASDNIVRVHASTLRKRLEQYFSSEGSEEPVSIELPKGNYAPVFRNRVTPGMAGVTNVQNVGGSPESRPTAPLNRAARRLDWRIWTLVALVALLGCASLFLSFRSPARDSAGFTQAPTVRQFWSQVFRPGRQTDVVLDDAGVGLYQELTGRAITLSGYFDRSYLRGVDDGSTAAKLPGDAAGSIVLKRHSSYASANLLWRLSQTASVLGGNGNVQFARDYSFHDIKSNSAILLGNSRSNPWIEPFENLLGLRWKYDTTSGTYYPVDTWNHSGNPDMFRSLGETGRSQGGYAAVALLGNLGGTGTVLIITGTGGSAMGAAGDFLVDEKSVAQLRSLLPRGSDPRFPFFEVLLRIKNRSSMPREAGIVFCREARK